ncbi:MAG: MarR family transcriptional regulator [Acidimicrobiia bacterium]|nr:MarR family transcriptional regulator [Acidimicrobiia bacterium]
MTTTAQPDLSVALTRAARVHRSTAAELLGELGLYPGQEQLLLALYDRDGQTQSDLARELGVEPPTVTKMIGRLEVAGYVKRKPHPTDRRATQVFLTPTAQRNRRKVQKAQDRLDQRALAGLSDRQRSTLRKLLEQVTENLED